MIFLFYVSVDTSVIIIVSKYQEKKVTARPLRGMTVDFIVFFVRKYTLMCAYVCLCLPMWSMIIG